MDELQAVKQLGIATSKDINEIVTKNIRATIRLLNSLEVWGEIKILIFKNGQCRRRVYITNEIHDIINQIEKS